MKNMADFYMCFPVQEHGLLDCGKVKEISELGYVYACKKVTEWDRDSLLNLPSHCAKSR